MYWDEIAEEIDKRVQADLATQYRPGVDAVRSAWKRHIVDVMTEKSKFLRALGGRRRGEEL